MLLPRVRKGILSRSYRERPVIPGCRRIAHALHMLQCRFPFVYLLSGRTGKCDCCGSVGGYSNVNRYCTFFDGPAGRHRTVQRLEGCPGVGKPSSGLRRDNDVFISWRISVSFDPGNALVHPVANGAVCIMLTGVHSRSLECAVRLNAIPPFPDGGGAPLHRIQPRRVCFLKQELVGAVGVTVTTQHVAQVWCAEKTCSEMVTVLPYVLD